jgi:hypothetical protein
VLTCEERDGSMSTQQIDFSSDVAATDDALLNPGRPRPALAGDPMSYTNAQQAGYPSRPDPQRTPDAYARWLQRVSRPANVVGAAIPMH